MSQKDSDVFVFPKGSYLKAGQTVTVSGEGGGGDYIWTVKPKVWNEKKEYTSISDRYGNELLRTQTYLCFPQ